MQSLWISDKRNLASFISLQPHYNLVHRAEFERELADVCKEYGLGVIPYSPLAGGFLTGKYRPDRIPDSERQGSVRRYFNDPNWRLLEQMEVLGKMLGEISISQIALAWMLSNPLITSPIIGPRSLEQLSDNLKAVDVDLSDDHLKLLNEATVWKT
jgi:aryl-alcohol dehydrogenase-like predicted oxidoreductase